jgi:hypothetical protein
LPQDGPITGCPITPRTVSSTPREGERERAMVEVTKQMFKIDRIDLSALRGWTVNPEAEATLGENTHPAPTTRSCILIVNTIM